MDTANTPTLLTSWTEIRAIRCARPGRRSFSQGALISFELYTMEQQVLSTVDTLLPFVTRNLTINNESGTEHTKEIAWSG